MALQGLLAIIPVIASKTGRRFAEDIAHSGLLSLLKASFRAIIESLCPSSRSLYSHPAGLAAFLMEPAADPTELNPGPAAGLAHTSCKERARRTGTIRMVPERDAAVPPVGARERMNGRGDPSGLGIEWGQLGEGPRPLHVAERACEAAEGQHGLITRDASGLILPFGFGSARGNLEGTETTMVGMARSLRAIWPRAVLARVEHYEDAAIAEASPDYPLDRSSAVGGWVKSL